MIHWQMHTHGVPPSSTNTAGELVFTDEIAVVLWALSANPGATVHRSAAGSERQQAGAKARFTPPCSLLQAAQAGICSTCQHQVREEIVCSRQLYEAADSQGGAPIEGSAVPICCLSSLHESLCSALLLLPCLSLCSLLLSRCCACCGGAHIHIHKVAHTQE